MSFKHAVKAVLDAVYCMNELVFAFYLLLLQSTDHQTEPNIYFYAFHYIKDIIFQPPRQ